MGSPWGDIASYLGFGGRGDQAPGATAGGPADPNKVVRDPYTGLYYDPTTGRSFTDASATGSVVNPNVAQQVATASADERGFLGQLPQLQQRQADVYGRQTALANVLNNQIAGHGPSAAATQLGMGLDQISRDQLSQAAGVSGAASPLAAMLAARNTGAASIGAQNAAALARVNEQLGAQGALANLLNSQGSLTNSQYGMDTQGALGFGNLAMGGQEAQQGLVQDKNKQQDTRLSNTFSAGGDLGKTLMAAFG